MTRRLSPGARTGRITAPPSKSAAHRLLIAAALGKARCEVRCGDPSEDIAATLECLRALGAGIEEKEHGVWRITPISAIPAAPVLPCGESGTTLRFLLPIVGALGANAIFLRRGRLPMRPLEPLRSQLEAHGMTLTEDGPDLHTKGALSPGYFSLPGNVSSQFISGLLTALPLLSGDSTLTVTGAVESEGYIAMTEQTLRLCHVTYEKHPQTDLVYHLPGGQRFQTPPFLPMEGDYSGAAFFLCIGAFSKGGVSVKGLPGDTAQGDAAILPLLESFGAKVIRTGDTVTVSRGTLRGQVIDAAAIPDLIPVLSVLAAAAEGETRILNAGRLRLKESDRLAGTAALIRAIGGEATEETDALIIRGTPVLRGGCADALGDHRLAMSAAVAACAASGTILLTGSESVRKSYPRFWEDFEQLTGGER